MFQSPGTSFFPTTSTVTQQVYKKRLYQRSLLLGLSLFLVLILNQLWTSLPLQAGVTEQNSATTPSAFSAASLPKGCPGYTPGDDTACCINGYVYLDGQPIAGAKVTITTTTNKSVTVLTKKEANGGELPYYQLRLNVKPLELKPNDKITIRVEYGDYTKVLPYTIKLGGQQVDIVLPHEPKSAYQFAYQLEPTPPDPFGFNQPNGVATDSSGNVYVLDKENGRVVVFDAYHQGLHQWGRFGSGPGQFRSPSAIAIDQQQNFVYVADGDENSIFRLQKFSLSGIPLGQLNTQVLLSAPINGIVVDGDGNLYVSSDTAVRKMNFLGQLLNSVQGNGQFNKASGLAIDTLGNLYVVDSGNHRVQKFSKDGAFLSQWGGQGNGDGQFANPQGIALDNDNHAYVVDSGNHRLQKFTSDGGFVSKWGSQGDTLFGFNRPSAITISGEDLYIADSGNHRIQSFTVNGESKFPWGHAGKITCFFNPGVMTINSQGVLRVANAYDGSHQGNWCLSQFQPDGTQLGNWPIPNVYNAIASDTNDNVYGLRQVSQNPPLEYVVDKFDNTGRQLFSWQIKNSLKDVNGFAVDGIGNIYVDGNTTAGQDQIDILDSATGEPKKVAPISFYDTKALAVDKANNLYVARQYHNVLIYDSNWVLKGTRANDAEEANILSISVAANNHLFVADTDGNYRLQELDEADTHISRWNPPPGNPNNNDIYTPTQILVDNTNNIKRVYVIEKGGGAHWDDAVLKVYQSTTFTQPIATINHSSHIFSVAQDERLILDGMGSASATNATISAYKWESDRSGVLGNSETLQIAASQLALGEHKISLTVQDSSGQWSAPVSLPISVTTGITPTPSPTQTTWTMLLYLNGDYVDTASRPGKPLIQRFQEEIQRLQQPGLPVNVNIAIQVDGPQTKDASRIWLQHDAQGNTNTGESSIAEYAMDNPNALAEFVRWGQEKFTTTRYYLAIADHGQAIRGISWDTTSDPNLGAYLTVKEVGEALRTPGLKPIDILHLDACSMNLLEVAYELKDVASILISSQYLAWDYFSYKDYAANIGTNTQPRELAGQIVTTYGLQVGGDGYPYTLSALNLTQAFTVNQTLDNLLDEIQTLRLNHQITNTLLHTIRDASQQFDSDGDHLNSTNDMYIDLKDWLQTLKRTVTVGNVPPLTENLLTVLTGETNPFILNSKAESHTLPDGRIVNLGQAFGLSIFYPRDLRNQTVSAYVDNELFSFTRDSQWANFLRSHTALSPGAPDPQSPPPPLAMLQNDTKRIFLPVVLR